MRVGAAQMDCQLKDKFTNLKKCEQFIKEAKAKSVDLLVFPECTMTGYMYESFDEAFPEAEVIPGKLSESLVSLCNQYEITCVLGMLEKEDDFIYNTALLITPQGIIGKYRKTHLLYLGVDRFTTPGNNISVHQLTQGKVAPLICYDLRAPEPTRVAALMGAQLVVSPTNLSHGAEAYGDFINRTRACENRIFLATSNRVGLERGFEFIGRSQIINTAGHILAEASKDQEELIYADITPKVADIKYNKVIPGEYEYHIFDDRKPHLYNILAK